MITFVSNRWFCSQWRRRNQWPRSTLIERDGNMILRNGSRGCAAVSVVTDAISRPVIDACPTPFLSRETSLKGYSLSTASDYCWSNTRKRGEKNGDEVLRWDKKADEGKRPSETLRPVNDDSKTIAFRQYLKPSLWMGRSEGMFRVDRKIIFI